MSSTQFLPLLSRDFSKLLEKGKNCDVTIRVGKGDDVKTFQAHSIILTSRSVYFDSGLDQVKNSDGDGFLLKLNLSPIAFNIILGYIYSGRLDLDDLAGENVLRLLVGCEELSLTPYAAAVDVALYDEILQFHILKTYNQSTTQILPARKKPVIESKILSHEQAKLISNWIYQHHNDYSENQPSNNNGGGGGNSKLTSLFSSNSGNKRSSIDSRRSIIDESDGTEEEKTNGNNNSNNSKLFEYNLLLRGSVDSFTPGSFHLRCDAKGPTITIFRLSGGGSGSGSSQVILGGYTSENWLSLNEAKWMKCDESFLFSLKEKDTRSFKISRIKENQDAMYLDRNSGPHFSDLHLLKNPNSDNKKNE
ncbi:6711_t:CDS:2, partial [Entrophospora sp. SA101]